jgi:hypothetical protein
MPFSDTPSMESTSHVVCMEVAKLVSVFVRTVIPLEKYVRVIATKKCFRCTTIQLRSSIKRFLIHICQSVLKRYFLILKEVLLYQLSNRSFGWRFTVLFFACHVSV